MSAKGSAPIETVALLTLLLLPIGPGVALYQQISDQLAAESIARHAIRSAMLAAEHGEFGDVSTALDVLSRSWQKQIALYDLSRSGDLVSLQVQIGNASAIATLGLEPAR